MLQAYQDLGKFSDPVSAAKAHDVALLHLQGGKCEEADLNFPRSTYDSIATSGIQAASMTELLSGLQRHGKLGSRRNSR